MTSFQMTSGDMLFGQLCHQNVAWKPVAMCKEHLQSKAH